MRAGALERSSERVELALAPEERRTSLPEVDPEARPRLECFPDRDRRRLALGLDRLRLAVVDHVIGRAVGRLADEDAVDRRGRLKAGGGVDRRRPTPFPRPRRCGHRERSSASPVLTATRNWSSLPLLRNPVADRERRTDRALGVVLVRGRSPEERHHRVADELLDSAAEALELLAQMRVVRSEQSADVLGVELLGAGGEADEIGEEHRHDLALLAHRRRRSLERRAAGVTEPGGVGILGRAAWADDHLLSVRLLPSSHPGDGHLMREVGVA